MKTVQPDRLALPTGPYSPVVASGDLIFTAGQVADDLGDFPAFNAVYRECFAEPYPVRTTAGVNLPDGILVELDAIARRPG